MKALTTAMLIGLIAVAPAPARAADAGEAVEMTLGSAVERAVASNLGIRIQATTLDVARETRRAAWAAYHPTFSLDVSYSPGMDHSLQRVAGSLVESLYRNYSLTATSALTNRFVTGTDVTLSWYHLSSKSERIKDEFQEMMESFSGVTDPTTTSFTASGAIEVRQNMLQGLGWWYNLGTVRRAELAENAEEVAYRSQVADVVGNTVKAYYELAYAQRAVEIAQHSLDLALGQREVTQARIEAGDFAPVELMKLDETVATRQGDLLEAQMTQRRAGVALRALLVGEYEAGHLGSSYRAIDLPTSPIPQRSLEASFQTALLHNPDVRRQELDLQGRQIAFRMSRQDLLPQLDFTASLALNGVGEFTHVGIEDVFSGNHPYWTVGVTLTVPLTNRTAETSFRQRRAEVEFALLSLKSLHETTLGEVETAYSQIVSYDEQVHIAETRVALAAQNVEAEEARYAAGKSTTREVLEVQQSLRDAQLAEIRARINALSTRVDLELVRGTLLEGMGISEVEP